MRGSTPQPSHLTPVPPEVKLTRTQRQIIDARQAIYAQPQPDNPDLTFSARELVQATLPHQTPRGNPPTWSRANGDYTLRIRPGYKTDPATRDDVCIGYPYGNVPRLLLLWLTTEAVRTKNRRLSLGNNLADFMRELGLDPQRGGRHSDRTRLYTQTERLFNASISFEYTGDRQRQWINMEVTSRGHLWWDFKQPDQQNLFASWVELSELFFEAITAHPVPLDMRTLRAIKASSLALDLYAWLAYRQQRVNRRKTPVFVSWKQLQAQFGAAYSNPKDFKRRCKDAMRKVLAVYHHWKIDEVRGGIEISPGLTLITPR